jgi:hypothetical protein
MAETGHSLQLRSTKLEKPKADYNSILATALGEA